MTKTLKILFTLTLAICLAACLCLVIACGPDNPQEENPKDDTITYTVTVKIDETTPASGVKVRLSKGTTRFPQQITDANGKVQFTLAPDSYTVTLDNLPKGYNADNATLIVTKEDHDLVVTLEKSFAYTVKLVDANNEPYYADNVFVGICTLDGTCLTPVKLESNGIAIIDGVDPGNYHVRITGLPDGANYAHDDDDYYTGKNFSATDTEMTIVITVSDITSVTSVTPMTEAEKAEYAATKTAYKNANGQQYLSYRVDKKLSQNAIAYYSLTAEITGQYTIYTDNSVSYLYNGTEFVNGDVGNFFSGIINCEKGKTYYFKAINNSTRSKETTVVVTVPFSSYVDHSGVGGILDLTLGKENSNAIIRFTPTEAGIYTLTVNDETPTAITYSTSRPNEIITAAPSDDEYKANNSSQYVAYTSNYANGYYIAITAKATSYPFDVNVRITKTANVSDTESFVKTQEKLVQYAKPTGKRLVGVPMNGTASELVYNQSDRYYHYGSEDGPVVVVKITGTLSEDRFYSGGALAYLERVNSRATYKFATQNANGEIFSNYTMLLRGFVNYEQVFVSGSQSIQLNIPSNLDPNEMYYARFVNEDGVYPLTEELKVFLQKFYEANKDYVEFNAVNSNKAYAQYAWMFPCYYYSDTTVTVDAIVGEYELVSLTEKGATYNVGDSYLQNAEATEVTIAKTSITLNVTEANRFTLTDNLSTYSDQGTWSKSGNTYTLTVPDRVPDPDNDGAMIDLVYSVTLDEQNGTITLSYQFSESNTVTIVLQKATNA